MKIFDSDIELLKMKKNTNYYYIQCVFKNETFRVMCAPWNGTMLDCMRIVRCNFFIHKAQADRVCSLLNQRYEIIRKEALRIFKRTDDKEV